MQRFVDASILGRASYMNGDRGKANALMLKENPEMTLAEVEDSVALMRAEGTVASGEARPKASAP